MKQSSWLTAQGPSSQPTAKMEMSTTTTAHHPSNQAHSYVQHSQYHVHQPSMPVQTQPYLRPQQIALPQMLASAHNNDASHFSQNPPSHYSYAAPGGLEMQTQPQQHQHQQHYHYHHQEQQRQQQQQQPLTFQAQTQSWYNMQSVDVQGASCDQTVQSAYHHDARVALHCGTGGESLDGLSFCSASSSEGESFSEDTITFPRIGASRSFSGALSKTSSESGISLSSFATILPHKVSLSLREPVPSRAGGQDSATKTLFRVRDAERVRRYRVVRRGALGVELSVLDARGRALWSVYSGPDERVKGLHKASSALNGTPSATLRMVRTTWLKRFPKAAELLLERAGGMPAVRLLSIMGDAVSKKFAVYSLAVNSSPLKIVSMKRGTVLESDVDTQVWETARWTIEIEPDVDSSLMSAIVGVLDGWVREEEQKKWSRS